MSFDAIELSRDLGEPFHLFLFIAGDQQYRYTTADHIITIGTADYYPDQPMESVEVKETQIDDKGKLNFKVIRNHEIANLFLVTIPRTISLFIFEGHESDTASETRPIWTGRVVACEWDEEDQATISCESATTVLQRMGLPYKFGSTCQHTLYRGGCRLDIFANSTLYAVDSFSGYTVTISDLIGLPENDYNGGLAIVNGVDYRMITGFDNTTGTFTLIRPFEGIEIGTVMRVAKGCNRTSDRCKELENFENFLGFDTVPTRNPFEGITKAGVFSGTSNNRVTGAS